MKVLDIYDPAQCCATGACSPDADDELAQFASSLEWLKSRGVQVNRYNLGHQPGAFATNATVRDAMAQEGMGVLPMLVADGNVISKGRYLKRNELGSQLGGLMAGVEVKPAAATACCAPSTKCCG